jgi:hypothetical protein
MDRICTSHRLHVAANIVRYCVSVGGLGTHCQFRAVPRVHLSHSGVSFCTQCSIGGAKRSNCSGRSPRWMRVDVVEYGVPWLSVLRATHGEPWLMCFALPRVITLGRVWAGFENRYGV